MKRSESRSAAASRPRASEANDDSIASIDLATLSDPSKAEALCERIAATGALEEARKRALSIVSEAKAALPTSPADGRYELLNLLADAVVERYC